MGFADQYLSKQKNFKINLSPDISGKLRFIVVIPSYCEPELIFSLQSLWNCDRPEYHVEVIIVINSPEYSSDEILKFNLQSIVNLKQWISDHGDPAFKFTILEELNLPKKHAGVGLARKIGMDYALARFNQLNSSDGLIISFDADSLCDCNYFIEIEKVWKKFPKATGFNIYFEHPVSGNQYPEKVYEGIILYEIHMRYVVNFLRIIGFPFAFHTIGSAFAVRACVYAKEGGMNKRKAGEDFYFLHKIIPLGNFYEINSTRVLPSPRPSERVPFGTGVSIKNYIQQKDKMFMTYAPDCFAALKSLFIIAPDFYKKSDKESKRLIAGLPHPIRDYLYEIQAEANIKEIDANCSSAMSFLKRFYNWFDAFRVVKYLNFATTNFYPQKEVLAAVKELLMNLGEKIPETCTGKDLLQILRNLDRMR